MADSNTQNNQGTGGSAQGDDSAKVINLSQVQQMEKDSVANQNILAEEEDLLGLKNPSPATATAKAQATKFHIPQIVKQNYPELVALILNTESMDDEEREYWFQILPIMTEDQVQKLRDILVNEKQQLAKLDAEYETELAKINDKHLSEWQAFESKQQREELSKKEEAYEEQESTSEEELLKKLSQL
jgi:hypothetical protein